MGYPDFIQQVNVEHLIWRVALGSKQISRHFYTFVPDDSGHIRKLCSAARDEYSLFRTAGILE